MSHKTNNTMLSNFNNGETDSPHIIDVSSYDLLPEATFHLASEYRQLYSCETLSERQIVRLGEILEAAQEDELLNSLLIDADFSLFHKNEVFSEDSIRYYREQQDIARINYESYINTMKLVKSNTE